MFEIHLAAAYVGVNGSRTTNDRDPADNVPHALHAAATELDFLGGGRCAALTTPAPGVPGGGVDEVPIDVLADRLAVPARDLQGAARRLLHAATAMTRSGQSAMRDPLSVAGCAERDRLRGRVRAVRSVLRW
jgi:hypothetical protein